ncbi:MAG: hypothetical protein JW797_06110 [Bradymonadales bacterium]|nr:hypothetical protein [Bradymonadales bacterium]
MSQSTLTTGLEPKEVADIHYRAIQEGNHKLFVSTLCQELQDSVYNSYSQPDMWWRSAQRMRDLYGVSYEFAFARELGQSKAILFYQGKTAGGAAYGEQVPITLIRESGGWRVKQASY